MGDAALPRTRTLTRTDVEGNGNMAPTFPDLVWAHHVWDKQRRAGGSDPAVEERYRETLAGFQAEHGKLDNIYWSSVDASAVGVTLRKRSRLRHADLDLRFHRATDWATRDAAGISEVLDRCETLALKTREVLRTTSERIATQWIFSLASHLLGYVERRNGQPDPVEARRTAHDAEVELARIEAYYDRAGTKAGRIVYVQGMVVLGVAILTVFAFLCAAILLAFDAYDVYSDDIQLIFACYAAGALGAIVSVMTRMASHGNKLYVDYEVGRRNLLVLGSLRPFVGAIWGVAFYFAVKGGLFQLAPNQATRPFYWFTILSFFAGFSERFTKVLIDNAEKAIPVAHPGHGERALREDRQPRQVELEPPLPPVTPEGDERA